MCFCWEGTVCSTPAEWLKWFHIKGAQRDIFQLLAVLEKHQKSIRLSQALSARISSVDEANMCRSRCPPLTGDFLEVQRSPPRGSHRFWRGSQRFTLVFFVYWRSFTSLVLFFAKKTLQWVNVIIGFYCHMDILVVKLHAEFLNPMSCCEGLNTVEFPGKKYINEVSLTKPVRAGV